MFLILRISLYRLRFLIWRFTVHVSLLFVLSTTIGPLQVAIHVTQNRRAGEQKSHGDKSNKRHT